MAHYCRYLVCILVLTCGLEAFSKPEAKVRTINFSVYAAKMPTEPIQFLIKPAGNAQTVALYAAQRSPDYRWTGSGPLQLFSESQVAGKGAEMSRKLVAEVMVPEDMTQVLLILFPNPAVQTNESAPAYLAYVFNDSPENLPAGRMVLLNASGMEFVGKINNSIVTVTPGLNPPLQVGSAVKIDLRVKFRERYYQSYAGSLRLPENERMMLLILPPYYEGSLEVQARVLSSAAPVESKGTLASYP